MAKNRVYTVPLKRTRKGKTNYKKRLKYLLSKDPRIIIRRSLKNIIIQTAEYQDKGDKVSITIKSTDLKKHGWDLPTGNVPSAYLTGLLFAKTSKLKKGVIDIGFGRITKNSRFSAAIKGIADGGVDIKYSKEIIPNEGRIKGEHTKTKETKKFEEVKEKILKI